MMSLKDTAALAPNLGLDYVLSSMAPSNYTLDKLVVSFPKFFSNVSDIVAASSNDAIQAFLSWKVIQSSVGAVIAPEVKPYKQFMNRLQGKVGVSSRSRYCPTLNFPDLSVGSGRRNGAMEDLYQRC
jgi:endothelin-converting enzyme